MSTTIARNHRRPVRGGGQPVTPYNANRDLAAEIEPRRYQTNVSLSQPPMKAADRPVREYVTNVTWRVGE
jgi:hypothetical protein